MAAGLFVYSRKSPAEKRSELMAWASMLTDPYRKATWNTGILAMSDVDVSNLYDYLFNYELPAKPVPVDLLVTNNLLWNKYNIPDFSDVMSINLGTIVTPSLPQPVNQGNGTITVSVNQTPAGGGGSYEISQSPYLTADV